LAVLKASRCRDKKIVVLGIVCAEIEYSTVGETVFLPRTTNGFSLRTTNYLLGNT
jgi:hypothetical protein